MCVCVCDKDRVTQEQIVCFISTTVSSLSHIGDVALVSFRLYITNVVALGSSGVDLGKSGQHQYALSFTQKDIVPYSGEG